MKRVGLVLGAGGVIGHAYHVATLLALREATGWDPRQAEIVVGTSAGSGVAALLRAGISVKDGAARALGEPLSPEAEERFRRAPASQSVPQQVPSAVLPLPASPRLLARAAFTPWRNRVGVIAAAALPPGRRSTAPIGASIRALYGDAWPRQRLWICALRLDDGRLTVFGRDGPDTDVGTAVEASCAIPGLFAPVTIAGDRYVDGGAHSPTNLDLLAGLGLDLAIACSPMSARRGVAPRSLTGQLRSFHAYRLGREARTVRTGGTEVLTFQPTREDIEVMGTNPMDPTRRKAVADQARASASRFLERPDVRERLAALNA